MTQIPIQKVQEQIPETTEYVSTGSSSSLQRLSASDVLSESQLSQETPENTLETASGDTISPNQNLVKESDALPETKPVADIKTICSWGFVGPVAVGWKNETEQVELLETFLISQWEKLTIDGVYDATDIEAVKNFQLEYKQDILDPWGIVAPTGYVFTTTIKKMKEIACE